jgi:alanine racemase
VYNIFKNIRRNFVYYQAWVEINIDALRYNIKEILKLVPAEKVMGVIKANAYGHGASTVAKELYNAGVNRFAVASVYEALDLRYAGIEGDILLLGGCDPAAVLELAENGITACAYNLEFAKKLSQISIENNVKIKCHVKLDTGMGRLGLDCRQSFDAASLKKEMEEIFSLEGLNITGAFTHFATADRDNDEEAEFKTLQYNNFKEATRIFKEIGALHGKTELTVHCSNSAATVMDFENQPSDLYRAGIILYGLTPSVGLNMPVKFKAVMSLKAKITQVKEIKKGDSVGYGRTFTAKNNMKVATVSIGYADGYMRNLSNKGKVLIGENVSPIVGRVCMDQIMVDVTGVGNVKSGDTVTLFGNGLPVEELGKTLGTINYELVCAVAHRVPRVYVESGKQVKIIRYRSI